MRLVADGLTKLWGQQAVVINRPGANGSIAARAASEAQPDGNTLFMPSLSTYCRAADGRAEPAGEMPKDFLPIGFIADQPMFITMKTVVPAKTLPEFITLAKKEPGKYSVAVSGVRPAHVI